ncbi:hypothetical protein [Rhodanobacter sp. B04]|uniref:hypothetical protein n=1 Tax=Rhodanobacter sp. B04 TaxID=1945860 RepID=UPI00143CBB5E|nr:hypothetical protein [Rhodanobacter sp. B04]
MNQLFDKVNVSIINMSIDNNFAKVLKCWDEISCRCAEQGKKKPPRCSKKARGR